MFLPCVDFVEQLAKMLRVASCEITVRRLTSPCWSSKPSHDNTDPVPGMPSHAWLLESSRKASLLGLLPARAQGHFQASVLLRTSREGVPKYAIGLSDLSRVPGVF